MSYTQEQIEEHFDLLPEEVQDKLFTPEIKEKAQKIGITVGVLTGDLKKLSTFVSLVILNLLSEQEFSKKCQAAFNLDEKSAEELRQIISREIFVPIEAVRTRAIEERARYEMEERELFEKKQVGVPANIPTEAKEEPLIPSLIPKVIAPQATEPATIIMHPFEEKMWRAAVDATALVSTPMPATFTPGAAAVPTETQSIPVVITPTPISVPTAPQAPQDTSAFTPASNTSPRGTFTHDPYREPIV